MPIPIYLTILRLIIPFTILRWPLFGILLSLTLDLYDWKLITIASLADFNYYQTWDKLMDLYYHVFIFIIVFKFKDKIAKKIAIFLFSFRLIGLSLFFITQQKSTLFFFPNVFENFVVFYLAYVFFSKKEILFTNIKLTLLILISLTIPKLIHEYFMHYIGKQPWEIYNVGAILGFSSILQEYANYLVFGTLLYIAPIIILFYLVKLQKPKR